MASKLITQNLRRFLRPQSLKYFSNRPQSTAYAYDQSTPETEVSGLSNGFRIASEYSGGDTCTVGIWVDSGSRHEDESNNGVAHFAEHMLFKGTQNRSQIQLETEIESIGAHLIAYTAKEQTAYYAKCHKKDLPAVVNILADIIQNPLLDDGTIEKERTTILKEMAEVTTNNELVAFDYLHSVAYQGTSLALPVLGSTQNINCINKSHLEKFISNHYTADRMVLSAAGGVDHANLVSLAEANFGGMAAPFHTISSQGLLPARYTGSMVKARDDDLPLARVILAVEGPGWVHPDNFAIMVGNMIIGSWNKSIAGHDDKMFGALVKEINAHNVMESYEPFNLCYTDTGLFGISMLMDRCMVENACWLMQYEWLRVALRAKESEVTRAKAALKTNLLSQLDGGTTPTCEDIGRQMLVYGRRIPLPELLNRIDQIDAKVVKDTFEKYWYDKCPVIAAVGPIEDVPDYQRFRRLMKSYLR